ncbi:MAG: murein biosynthesis integral membrane protein MurJ [Gemmatimonadaceae bacterium]
MSSDRGGRAATVVGFGILLSRLTGLLRGFFIARYFGMGLETEAFNTASRIPNIMRNLLGEGALSASFVPVYSRLLAKGEDRAANALANAVLGLLMGSISILTLVGVAAAPALTTLLAGGFTGEKRELTIQLTQILFPMTALMVLSGWCLGIQNSHRRFFWSYASAAMWNVAQIVFLLWRGPSAPLLRELAVGLAWATLVGSILQVVAQLPEVLKLVRPIRLSLDKTTPGVAETLKNVLPVVTALGVVQLSSLIDVQIASRLPGSPISSLNNANAIVLLPVALFGVSVAASSLPEFSRESESIDKSALLERLRGGWQRVLFYIVPSTIACIVYGDLIVGLLYRTGRFTASDEHIVHSVLAGFAVGLISYGSVKLLASAHYALKDYRTPLRASLSSLGVSAVISIGLAIALHNTIYAAAGIALGTAIGSYVNLSVQIGGLRAKLGPLYTAHMWRGTRRIVIATIAAAIVAAPVRYLMLGKIPFIAAPPTLAVFSLAYLVIAWLMGSGEAARWLRQPARAESHSQ